MQKLHDAECVVYDVTLHMQMMHVLVQHGVVVQQRVWVLLLLLLALAVVDVNPGVWPVYPKPARKD